MIPFPREKAQRLSAMWLEKGALATVGYGCSRILPRLLWFVEDRVLGGAVASRTRKNVAVSDMAIESDNRGFANRYEATPTPILVLWLIRKVLPRDRSAWSFIDVGAGKGRVVAAAASQGFRKVIGIELASDLCLEANRMLSDLGLADAGDVQIHQADATTFDIPSGPCVFYLFNPFQESVVERFIDHALLSYTREARPLRFVYLNPVCKYAFEKHQRLRQVALPRTVATIFSALSPWPVCLFEISQ